MFETINSSSECKTEEGITIGLIDSLLAISKVLRPRLESLVNSKYEGNSYESIGEALKDLNADSDIRECIDFLSKYLAWKPDWGICMGSFMTWPPGHSRNFDLRNRQIAEEADRLEDQNHG